MRAALVVLDGFGVGEMPDAAEYGDRGADTIGHLWEAATPRTPNLAALGLAAAAASAPGRDMSRLPPAPGAPTAAHGAMRETSPAKDTLLGHWELAGVVADRPLATFPPGPPAFPAPMVEALERRTGARILGNLAASGTEIIERLGTEHLATDRPIAYTSVDSVFQVAAHIDPWPLDRLYAFCREARAVCDDYGVGRVIARPFAGEPGSFRRTPDRRDFTMPPPAGTILDALREAGADVVGVGKIPDIFAHRGFTREVPAHGNDEILARAIESIAAIDHGLVFANLIDFDMLYGHRRDADGYARALEAFDAGVPDLLAVLRDDDLAILTADHGNDPTFRGTDHTREHVPLLVAGPRVEPRNLGLRETFADVAQLLATEFGLPPMPSGTAPGVRPGVQPPAGEGRRQGESHQQRESRGRC